MELKAGTHRKAKWVIRHYREIVNCVERIEKRRKKLVSRIFYDEDKEEILPLDKQYMPRITEDRKLVTTYVEGRTAIEIVNTILSECLSKSDTAIMTDICLNGMSVTEAMDRNHVSESTVKRARLRMEAAYIAESMAREEAVKPNT